MLYANVMYKYMYNTGYYYFYKYSSEVSNCLFLDSGASKSD